MQPDKIIALHEWPASQSREPLCAGEKKQNGENTETAKLARTYQRVYIKESRELRLILYLELFASVRTVCTRGSGIVVCCQVIPVCEVLS